MNELIMGRIVNAKKNITYSIISNIIKLVFQFVSRTVFIYTIGATYLGINGLYTNILSVLSLAELGFGTAMIFSLYKPIAENDLEKIKSLMYVYKKIYLIIAGIISALGILLIPLLKYIIKDPGDITLNELILFYLIFLFNTVSTYFVSYKYSLVNAYQKNYVITNSNTIMIVLTTIFQIVVLLIFENFVIYLLIASAIQIVYKLIMNKYINIKYPFLLEKNLLPLDFEEKKKIKKNIKALVYHKVAGVGVHQTDNIIISAFINITTVGFLSNYIMIITSVTTFIDVIFNSTATGLGNLVATENMEKQYLIFKIYRFIAFWLYGFAAIAFLILMEPFIELWIGKDMLLVSSVLYLIIIDYYFKGHRIVINNFKSAAGIFDADKWISIIQMFVNLVVSIIMVILIGLPGVFVGTVVQGLVGTFTRPYILYKNTFDKKVIEYYKDSIIYLVPILISLTILFLMKDFLLTETTVFRFVIMTLSVAIIPNILFLAVFYRREEFVYLFNIVKTRLKGVKK